MLHDTVIDLHYGVKTNSYKTRCVFFWLWLCQHACVYALQERSVYLSFSNSLSKPATIIFLYEEGNIKSYKEKDHLISQLSNLTISANNTDPVPFNITPQNAGHLIIGINSSSEELSEWVLLHIRWTWEFENCWAPTIWIEMILIEMDLLYCCINFALKIWVHSSRSQSECTITIFILYLSLKSYSMYYTLLSCWSETSLVRFFEWM